MNLYLDSGYINIRKIRELGITFNFLVGGRGTGKTYGTLKDVVLHGETFFLIRRRQKQVDAIKSADMSPFKRLNMDFDWNILPAPIGQGVYGYYDMIGAGEDEKVGGKPVGYLTGLTNIASLRGFDASDVDVIIYDEFIPEKHETTIREEFAAFANAYETINRNREMQGKPPVQVMCLANANTLANPIFEGFDLVGKAEQMKRKHQQYTILKDKGIAMFLFEDSPISKAKAETALYKATVGSDFTEMSIENKFSELKDRAIVKRQLSEYTPIVSINEICVYKHKSEGKTYVSEHISGSPKAYGNTEKEFERFKKNYPLMWSGYISNKVEFESYKALSKFLSIYH